MAGKIVADTLEHSTAGSIATNYVVEGSAKAWVNFNGTGTIAARDSLNVSSLTDVSAGVYETNYSSAFGGSTYVAQGTCIDLFNGSAVCTVGVPSASVTRFATYGINQTLYDGSYVGTQSTGDLA
jgi:hypothetical protein